MFSTNEGSGLADTVITIEKYTKGNVVKNAFSIRGKRAQDSKDKVEAEVKKWIKEL